MYVYASNNITVNICLFKENLYTKEYNLPEDSDSEKEVMYFKKLQKSRVDGRNG